MRRSIVLVVAIGCVSESAIKNTDQDVATDDLGTSFGSDPTDRDHTGWWRDTGPDWAHTGSPTETGLSTGQTGGHTGVPVDTSVPVDTGGTGVPVDTSVPVDTGFPIDTGLGPIEPLAVCTRVVDPVEVATCGASAALVNGSAYATVAGAVAAAAAGDIVDVCPGTWVGPVVVGRDVTLRAMDPAPGATVLSGGGTDRVLTLGSQDVTLDGLTISDGYDSYEGGGVHANGTRLTLDCVIFERNVADYEGGALEVYEGDARATGCTFRDNYADYSGGALELDGWNPARMQISDSVFERNESGYEGGAISVGSWAHDRLKLDRVDFTENVARGGAAIQAGSWDEVTIEVGGGRFTGNEATYSGGAVDVQTDLAAHVTFVGSEFTNNRSPTGAVLLVSSRVSGGATLFDSVVATSNTSAPGNAVIMVDATGGSFECVACDLGTAPTDNTPNDVSGYGSTSNYGAGASFVLP